MTLETYNEIMGYLDVIEAALNRISAAQGGETFAEFMARKSTETI